MPDPDNKCFSCSSSCLTCSGAGTDKCTSCEAPNFLLNGYCTTNCGIGKYGVTTPPRTCELCSGCYTCVDDATKCTGCESPNYL